jgi:tRNA (cytidine56-2'-O)-methyltransferase
MIAVLRIGHRISRDKRITTHVALVARAFGADSILIDTKDDKIVENIRSTCKRFGGDFEIRSGVDKKRFIREWIGKIVHLTMYGGTLEKAMKKIDKKKDLLIIVGAEKVPRYIYEMSDFNVSIGNQPHSEVAAVAIFLDRFTNGLWQKKKFKGKLEIMPCDRGKIVKTKDE